VRAEEFSGIYGSVDKHIEIENIYEKTN